MGLHYTNRINCCLRRVEDVQYRELGVLITEMLIILKL